jgi:hypothetical protein
MRHVVQSCVQSAKFHKLHRAGLHRV